MKKTVCVLLAIIFCALCFPVNAADSGAVFTFEGGKAPSNREYAEISVVVTASGGISGASVNIIFDDSLVEIVGYEIGSGLTCDTYSVVDSGFNQIRFVFCDSKGGLQYSGTILKLKFECMQTSATQSVIYINEEEKAVFDGDYAQMSYSVVPGMLVFPAG